jgi:hypothetical protein
LKKKIEYFNKQKFFYTYGVPTKLFAGLTNEAEPKSAKEKNNAIQFSFSHLFLLT